MTRFSLCVTVKFLKETISESADAQDFSIRKVVLCHIYFLHIFTKSASNTGAKCEIKASKAWLLLLATLAQASALQYW